MYRYVEIDLTRGADDVCSSYTIGRDGENLATALKVILPDKFVNSNIIFEFKMSDGSAFSSKMIPFNEEIVYEIQDFLMIEGLMTISIIAIDSTTGAVIKPFQKNFIVSSSTGILPSQGIPYGVADDHEKRIALLENSSIELQEESHKHSNKELLDKFSATDEVVFYDGKTFGDSAYEIAVKNGFVGTESEWIESLKGTNGISPSIRTVEAPKGYVLEIIDANGESYISLLHGKDGVSPTVSIKETETGHDVVITDTSGDHSFSVPNGSSGISNEKLKVKSKTYEMGWNEGHVDTNVYSTSSIEFFVYEDLPQNVRIIDFSFIYKDKEYSSSELACNNIISPLDIIRINPIMPYDSDNEAYLPIIIGCKNKTGDLYTNIMNTNDLSFLTLYYMEVE